MPQPIRGSERLESEVKCLLENYPPPWKISDTGSAFKIANARGRPIAWCYYRRESALRNEYPSREEAQVMAKTIVRLLKSE